MRAHGIRGGGGLLLHVEEHGPASGPPIVFIHGFSQCRLCWNRQVHSALAEDHRLVTVDIRGHGLSEKPHDAYGDGRLWADDVAAVIAALGLVRPVLVGWSYGGAVIADYLRHHGPGEIAGINLVGAVTKLGAPAKSFLGASFTALIPDFFSSDMETGTAALQELLGLCSAKAPSPEDFYFFLGFNVIVPPHVRHGLFLRTMDSDDLLAALRLPVLVSHGEADEVVLPAMAEHHCRVIAGARPSRYRHCGHMPFWEDAVRFNAELSAFVEDVGAGARS